METSLNLAKKHVPCFLCGNGLEIKSSKRAKPYLVCDSCGMQIFVRGAKGILRLAEKENAIRQEIILSPGENVLAITALSNRLRELRALLADMKINSLFGILGKDNPDKLAVESEIRRVEHQLRKIARGGT